MITLESQVGVWLFGLEKGLQWERGKGECADRVLESGYPQGVW